MKMIRVADETHETLRRLAFERRVSQGDIVAGIIVELDRIRPEWEELTAYRLPDVSEFESATFAALAADPRSAAERAQDEHAAEVLDTQASDRP